MSDWLQSLLRSYEEHPLTRRSILDRLELEGRSLVGLTELDLARDDRYEIHDQNHVGGLEFTRELGERIELGPMTTILDIGSGLGGTLRWLAHHHGCKGLGIDISANRTQDAQELSALVGLDPLVEFITGDFQDWAAGSRRFDLILSQSSFCHMPRPRTALEKCHKLLVPGGRLVIEDSVLLRPPSEAEAALLLELCTLWHAKLGFVEIYETDLRWNFGTAPEIESRTQEMIECFRDLKRRTPHFPNSTVPDSELRGWTLAIELGEAGLLGYVRMISDRPHS